jgi:hypothetical protein
MMQINEREKDSLEFSNSLVASGFHPYNKSIKFKSQCMRLFKRTTVEQEGNPLANHLCQAYTHTKVVFALLLGRIVGHGFKLIGRTCWIQGGARVILQVEQRRQDYG